MQSQKQIGGLILLMATSLIAAAPPKQDALDKHLDGFQGTWKIVNLKANGESAPEEIVAALKLVFKDDTLTFTPGEPGFKNYRYKLDPTTSPASFDMTHSDGSQKGETRKGIYSLEGDRLKICFSNEDDRPKELTAKAESGQLMYTLQREKP
jgi:uncharacterized protein (TIGR03067 family)